MLQRYIKASNNVITLLQKECDALPRLDTNSLIKIMSSKQSNIPLDITYLEDVITKINNIKALLKEFKSYNSINNVNISTYGYVQNVKSMEYKQKINKVRIPKYIISNSCVIQSESDCRLAVQSKGYSLPHDVCSNDISNNMEVSHPAEYYIQASGQTTMKGYVNIDNIEAQYLNIPNEISLITKKTAYKLFLPKSSYIEDKYMTYESFNNRCMNTRYAFKSSVNKLLKSLTNGYITSLDCDTMNEKDNLIKHNDIIKNIYDINECASKYVYKSRICNIIEDLTLHYKITPIPFTGVMTLKEFNNFVSKSMKGVPYDTCFMESILKSYPSATDVKNMIPHGPTKLMKGCITWKQQQYLDKEYNKYNNTNIENSSCTTDIDITFNNTNAQIIDNSKTRKVTELVNYKSNDFTLNSNNKHNVSGFTSNSGRASMLFNSSLNTLRMTSPLTLPDIKIDGDSVITSNTDAMSIGMANIPTKVKVDAMINTLNYASINDYNKIITNEDKLLTSDYVDEISKDLLTHDMLNEYISRLNESYDLKDFNYDIIKHASNFIHIRHMTTYSLDDYDEDFETIDDIINAYDNIESDYYIDDDTYSKEEFIKIKNDCMRL